MPPTSETTPLWSPITPIVNLSLVCASALPIRPAKAMHTPAINRISLSLYSNDLPSIPSAGRPRKSRSVGAISTSERRPLEHARRELAAR